MLEYDVEWPAQPGTEHSGHLLEHGFLGNPTRNLGLGRDNDSGGETVSPSNEVILLITQKPSSNAVAGSLHRSARIFVALPGSTAYTRVATSQAASVNNSTNSLGTASAAVLGGKTGDQSARKSEELSPRISVKY